MPDDASHLEAMVRALEDRLVKSKSSRDGIVALGLLAAAGTAVASWFALGGLGLGTIGKVLGVVVVAFSLFVAWGLWIAMLEKRAMATCYRVSVNPAIAEYVRSRSMSRHDFDAVAARLVGTDSTLRPFLFGGDRELEADS